MLVANANIWGDQWRFQILGFGGVEAGGGGGEEGGGVRLTCPANFSPFCHIFFYLPPKNKGCRASRTLPLDPSLDIEEFTAVILVALQTRLRSYKVMKN